MRRLRVRFTVRRMMLAVAIVAAGLWAVRMARRSGIYRDRALACAFREIELRHFQGQWGPNPGSRIVAETAAQLGREAVHYGRLEIKYRRAARRPWLAVAPDPPEPR